MAVSRRTDLDGQLIARVQVTKPTMPDRLPEHMPDLMPKVMDRLVPHMLPEPVPFVTRPMSAHLRGD